MPKRAIAVTSTSSMGYYRNNHDIRVLPLHIYFEEKEFLDVLEVNNDYYQKWIAENPNKQVTSSPPKLDVILHFFNDLLEEGYKEVIVITLSARISQSYEFLDTARSMFKSRLKIVLFNSKRIGFCESIFALAAARLVKKSVPTEEITQYLEAMTERNRLFFGIDDVKGVNKNGKLPTITNLKSSIFQIKPVFSLDSEGDFKVIAKTMSTEKAMDTLCLRMKEYINFRPYLLFVHTCGSEKIDNLFKLKVKQHLKADKLPQYPLSPVVTVHTGARIYALGVFIK